MALTNAEKQKRWRDKRNALAKQALELRNQSVPTETPKQRALNKAFRDGYDTAEAVFSEKTISVGTISRVIRSLDHHTYVSNGSKAARDAAKAIKEAVLAGDDKVFKILLAGYVSDAISRGARKLGYVETGSCTVSVGRMARPATLEAPTETG